MTPSICSSPTGPSQHQIYNDSQITGGQVACSKDISSSSECAKYAFSDKDIKYFNLFTATSSVPDGCVKNQLCCQPLEGDTGPMQLKNQTGSSVGSRTFMEAECDGNTGDCKYKPGGYHDNMATCEFACLTGSDPYEDSEILKGAVGMIYVIAVCTILIFILLIALVVAAYRRRGTSSSHHLTLTRPT